VPRGFAEYEAGAAEADLAAGALIEALVRFRLALAARPDGWPDAFYTAYGEALSGLASAELLPTPPVWEAQPRWLLGRVVGADWIEAPAALWGKELVAFDMDEPAYQAALPVPLALYWRCAEGDGDQKPAAADGWCVERRSSVNVLPNPGFAWGTPADPARVYRWWRVELGIGYSRVVGEPLAATGSVRGEPRVISLTAEPSVAAIVSAETVLVQPGMPYLWSVDGRAQGNCRGQMILHWRQDDQHLGDDIPLQGQVRRSEWQSFSGIVQAPLSANRLSLELVNDRGTGRCEFTHLVFFPLLEASDGGRD
jgi:hypothetical protein